MNTPFRIEHEWFTGNAGEAAHDEARAEVSIWLNGICVTEVEDRTGEMTRTRRSVLVSATRMARWFAGNWWRLRWEPEEHRASLDWHMSHNLASAGGGYLWPSLTLSSDGETVLAVSKPSDPNGDEPIRYLQDYAGVIPAIDFEGVIDHFVKAAIDGMSAEARMNTDLIDLWAEVSRERAEPELTDVRKLEARLGYDPGEAPDALITSLLELHKIYGADAIQELAVVSKDHTVDQLESLGAEIRRRGEPAQLPNCDAIREQYRAQINPLDPPWRRGEQAARIARDFWGLPHGMVQSSTLIDLFGVRLNEQPQSNLPLSAGLRDSPGDEMRVSLHQRHPTGRRFTMTRLVADQVATPTGEHLLPATSSRTSRQKFQRAFAQEFLCPLEELMEFLGAYDLNDYYLTDDDLNDASGHFEVSSLTIKTTLVNKGVIERDNLPSDWAI